MKYTKQEIKKAVRALPENLQDALSSTEATDAIISIQKKYNLHVDQAGELADQATLVKVGLAHPIDFIKNVREGLHVSDEVARQIAQDVNEQIFRPIRESLKRLHGLKTGGEEEMKPPQAPNTTLLTPNVHATAYPPTPPLNPTPKTFSPEVKKVEPTPPLNPVINPKETALREGGLKTLSSVLTEIKQATPNYSPKPTPPVIPATPKENKVITAPSNILEDKLGATVKLPKDNSPATPDAQKPSAPTKGYGNDPYREPTN